MKVYQVFERISSDSYQSPTESLSVWRTREQADKVIEERRRFLKKTDPYFNNGYMWYIVEHEVLG